MDSGSASAAAAGGGSASSAEPPSSAAAASAASSAQPQQLPPRPRTLNALVVELLRKLLIQRSEKKYLYVHGQALNDFVAALLPCRYSTTALRSALNSGGASVWGMSWGSGSGARRRADTGGVFYTTGSGV